MNTWIALTETEIAIRLLTAQRETLLARPARGSANDALSTLIADVTDEVRDAVRAVPQNRLSADASLLPPEFINEAAYLVIEQLEGRIPGFTVTSAQLDSASLAASALSRVRTGDQPIRLPDEPEASPSIRTSFGPEVLRVRTERVSSERLRGL